MGAVKEQFCDYCGKPLGVFAFYSRFDGPLVCDSRECERDAREDESAGESERDEWNREYERSR